MDFSVNEYLNLFNPFLYFSNGKGPSNNPLRFYNRVYLCIEKDHPYRINHQIKGFDCFLFPNFKEANLEYEKKYSKSNYRFAMIPVCKFIPFYFDSYIIDYKLKNKFWLGNHTFYKKSSKSL